MCSTDDLDLTLETIRHRYLLLMNQNETLSSTAAAKPVYPMGRRRRLHYSHSTLNNGLFLISRVSSGPKFRQSKN